MINTGLPVYTFEKYPRVEAGSADYFDALVKHIDMKDSLIK